MKRGVKSIRLEGGLDDLRASLSGPIRPATMSGIVKSVGAIRQEAENAREARQKALHGTLFIAYKNTNKRAPPDEGFEAEGSLSFGDEDAYIADISDVDEDGYIHGAGEIDEGIQATLEGSFMSIDARRAHKRPRTRYERHEHADREWNRQHDALVQQYLHWISGSRDQPSLDEDASMHAFAIRVLSINMVQRKDELANVVLLRYGLLGNAPEAPATAIDLHTLEVYHRLHRRHSRLGIQPFVQMLCDLNNINYSSFLRDSFSSTFDVYLHLLRTVHHRLQSEMGRDIPNWRSLHSCPCCHYKLNGEVPLYPAVQFASDGNNSARRMESAGSADRRVFNSDYFILREDVDTYKDEVRSSARGPRIDHDYDPNDDVATNRPGRCTSDFRASRPDGSKRALDIYENTGMFASACRHGIMQKVCEMVRSGELAKYGLATVAYLLDVHGNDVGLGQDTGCAFSKTVASSRLLGDKARAQNLMICVNAFHGYAHNRLCQLNFHPLYIPGSGLSDLEQMERVFSSSNNTSRLIRYASAFHYMQTLDLFFQQWDDDRYSELSAFLYRKYKQALKLIADNAPQVQALCQRLSITTAEIDTWPDLERSFLANLKEVPDERKVAAEYIRALEARDKADVEWQKASSQPYRHTSNADHETRTSETLAIKNAQRIASEEYLVRHRNVVNLESRLGIAQSWSKSSEEYCTAATYLQHQDFYRASDRLQLLVVQRLQELSKAWAGDTGYKLQGSIGKAIERRSAAVRTALNTYNRLAAKMDPPAAQIRWQDLVQYTYLSELEILKHSYFQADIREQAWAKPINRDVATKYFKTKRAHEEITRLNVEARCLRTWAAKENADIERHTNRLKESNPALAAALSQLYAARVRANKVHLARLDELERLPGYSGAMASDEHVDDSRKDTYLDIDLDDDNVRESMHHLSTFVENLD
ncbi:hypothetical protein CONPUDRAFT_155220 [Coniophora puteana RWD-64-598 SS2]|uniref:CxC1-like cysteine cluster associated with KDZ transposases domain-containing protein n=1 Tax=Coniophora puteana (strain RWD-64-598) TaxID=741705 RepID=A0A5M3ML58_CONPW|nr:uncharacterized protein CONPUDRAFT_155220 [Coniophora puteana RWD-64-598 SS2]EIW79823.1 hypothetical protein CONPUDRAFT_155220 [Coniophora puteana RWD-64-598 SS2]